jgi:protein gp37
MPELRPRVFPSLCDWLDGEVPIEWLADFLRLIFLTPNLTWLLLTKSPENFRRRLLQAFTWIVDANEAGPWSIPCEMWLQGWLSKEKPIPPGNVVIGVSVENQKYADERREVFKSIPARVKFVSYEPALENVDWSGWEFVDQVIFGGESGPGARECDPQWGRNALAFCREHGISFFCKQLGAHIITNGVTGPGQHWPRPTGLLDTGKGYFRKHLVDRKGGDPSEWPEDLRVREFPMGKTTNVHE